MGLRRNFKGLGGQCGVEEDNMGFRRTCVLEQPSKGLGGLPKF